MDAEKQAIPRDRQWFDFGDTSETNNLYDAMSVQEIAELCVLWRKIRSGLEKVN